MNIEVHNIKIRLAVALLLTAVPAVALNAQKSAAPAVAVRYAEHSLAVPSFAASVYDNPAMQSGRYATSLNRLAVGYDNRHATVPPLLEQGDGTVLWGGGAEAWLTKGRTTLFGSAHYDKGTERNVRYCETEHYDLLYPYVMADTVGGGRSNIEDYDFRGGFAVRLSPRWVIGAAGRYTARMDYRTVDPRPKNLTGDLSISAGVQWRPWQRYAVGLSAAFRRYKQTNQVKFYDEVSIPATYHLTGLGTDYYRFRGENTSTYYKGTGGSFAVQLMPAVLASGGAFASAGYSYLDIDKVISSLNELPLVRLQTSVQTAQAGYMLAAGSNTFGVRVDERYERRSGTENIFGSAASNIYPQIASAPQYVLESTRVMATLLWQYHEGRQQYNAELSLGRCSARERHADPYRRLRHAATQGALKAEALLSLRGISLKAAVNGAAEWASQPAWSGSDGGAMTVPVEHRIRFLAGDAWQTGVSAEALVPVRQRFALFARAGWQYQNYLKHEHTQLKTVSVGMEF